MKVAVLEFLCGGGLQSQLISPPNIETSEVELYQPLYQEGLEMLTALSSDLTQCGHDVHTCIDQNVAANPTDMALFSQPTHLHIQETEIAWLDCWVEIALQCDRTIVIAPELHQQLERIVQKLRSVGASVIASSMPFIQATSDKLLTAKFLADSKVLHPDTQSLTQYLVSKNRLYDFNEALPVTLKRRDGAGCLDMKYFADESKLNDWLSKPTSQSLDGEDWIVQRWHTGQPASMAIIAGDEWQVLGSVEQCIDIENVTSDKEFSAVSYLGGTAFLRCVSIEQLEKLAIQVREALPAGAAGWIGIDFQIQSSKNGSQELVVIEVNPRLTTSYLCYRKRFGHSIANAIVGVA